MKRTASPEERYRAGRLARARGDSATAERCYRDALRQRPDFVEAWISLGILLRSDGRAADADASLRAALRLAPDHAVALLNLGNVQMDLGMWAEASRCFQAAITRDPDLVEAHVNAGKLALAGGDHASAGACFAQALSRTGTHVDALDGMGMCLLHAGRPQDAIPCFERALALRPAFIECRFTLAAALLLAGELPRAREVFAEVLRLEPAHARAEAGLAAALERMGESAEPHARYARALQLAPENHWVRDFAAYFLLRHRAFASGWPLYESRTERTQYRPTCLPGTRRIYARGFPCPRWEGQSLTGRRLLITAEQGLGDEIMFASMHAEIVAESSSCVVECDARLAALFARSTPGLEVFGVGRAEASWFEALESAYAGMPPFDFWSPIGSLARYRRGDAAAFPRHHGYLQADRVRVAHWRDRLSALGPGAKIGISWRGGTVATNSAARSPGLDALRPLFDRPGTTYVSLQYGDCAAELRGFTAATGIPIMHWSEAIEDYDETAALCCALDLTVSVCTSIVHLNGALGRPVWVMAPAVPEWRYGRSEDDMLWYPSARVFRQTAPGDWAPVLSQVVRELDLFERVRA